MIPDDDLTEADIDARYRERMKARAIRMGAPDDDCDDDAPDEDDFGMADRDFA